MRDLIKFCALRRRTQQRMLHIPDAFRMPEIASHSLRIKANHICILGSFRIPDEMRRAFRSNRCPNQNLAQLIQLNQSAVTALPPAPRPVSAAWNSAQSFAENHFRPLTKSDCAGDAVFVCIALAAPPVACDFFPFVLFLFRICFVLFCRRMDWKPSGAVCVHI